jgi:hypothetical protein
MLSWNVGAVKITRIVELEIPVAHNPARPFLAEATPEALRAIPWLYPDYVDEEDRLRLSIHALLVEAPGFRLVVDTCIGNDRPRQFIGDKPLATDFLDRFAAAGWTREGVNAVVCTHLHVDHVGWNTMLDAGKWVPTFPNARYLIGRKEFEHWSAVPDTEIQVTGNSIGTYARPYPGPRQCHDRIGGCIRGDHRRPDSPPLPNGAPRVVAPLR